MNLILKLSFHLLNSDDVFLMCLCFCLGIRDFLKKAKPRSVAPRRFVRGLVGAVVRDTAVLGVVPGNVRGFGAFHVVNDLFAFGVELCDGVVWVVVEEEFVPILEGFVEPFCFGLDRVHWVVVDCGNPEWVFLCVVEKDVAHIEHDVFVLGQFDEAVAFAVAAGVVHADAGGDFDCFVEGDDLVLDGFPVFFQVGAAGSWVRVSDFVPFDAAHVDGGIWEG